MNSSDATSLDTKFRLRSMSFSFFLKEDVMREVI